MLILLHDGSTDGIFSAVYFALKSKRKPDFILNADKTMLNFLDEYHHIDTNFKRSGYIYDAARRMISPASMNMIHLLSLSHEADVGMIIYRYLLLGFAHGKKIEFAYADDAVLDAWQIRKNVISEYHKYLGFLRFDKIQNDVYYAAYEPKNNIGLLLAEHFSDRMKNEKWIINDRGRNTAAIYNGKEYLEVSFRGEYENGQGMDEDDFKALWKGFLEALTIEERRNHRLQTNNMPKRYRSYMTEML